MDLIEIIRRSLELFISNGVKINENKYKMNEYMFDNIDNNINFYKNNENIFNLCKNSRNIFNISVLNNVELNNFIDFMDFNNININEKDKNRNKESVK